MTNQFNITDWNVSNKINQYIKEEGEGKLTIKEVADKLNEDKLPFVPKHKSLNTVNQKWTSDRLYTWLRKIRPDIKIGKQIKRAR